jgi:hypothetical protein
VLQGKYDYWFDIFEAKDKNEILASYNLPISQRAKAKLEGYRLPSNFPAVIYHQNAKYSSYYFSGDYADESDVPVIYQTRGLDAWKRNVGSNHSFYWTTYVPMMSFEQLNLRRGRDEKKKGNASFEIAFLLFIRLQSKSF